MPDVPKHILKGAFQPAFATGAVHSTPFFLDILYVSVVEEKYRRRGQDPKLFTPVLSQDDKIIGFERYNGESLLVDLKGSNRRLNSWIGSTTQYCVWIPKQSQALIERGFEAICNLMISAPYIEYTEENPFFYLSMAEVCKDPEMIKLAASRCFEILNRSRPKLARSWLDSRDLPSDMKDYILRLFNRKSDQLTITQSQIVRQVIEIGILDTTNRHIIDPGTYYLSDKMIDIRRVGLDVMSNNNQVDLDIIIGPLFNYFTMKFDLSSQNYGFYGHRPFNVGLLPYEVSQFQRNGYRSLGVDFPVSERRADLFGEIMAAFNKKMVKRERTRKKAVSKGLVTVPRFRVLREESGISVRELVQFLSGSPGRDTILRLERGLAIRRTNAFRLLHGLNLLRSESRMGEIDIEKEIFSL